MMFGPNPDAVHPNENIPSVCYIKNVITRPNIEAGDYTYYDDAATGGEDFEAHVTYPFNSVAHGWEKCTPALDELPFKGDTVVGNDVWIGQNVTILPGVHIGDGAIIGTRAVVTQDVPPYTIVGGVPAKPIRKRYDGATIDALLHLRWWDWPREKLAQNIAAIQAGQLEELK